MTPSGEFVVVWTDNRDRSFFIYGQRYSSLGESMGGNFKIVAPQGWNSTYYRPTVSINPKGDFVITWTATFSQTRREIHAVRVSSKNEILASAFKVNDSDSTAFPSFPDVAMDAAGDFVITWQEQRSESQDIYAQRYNFKGEASGSNFRVNETRGQYFKGLPKVAMNLSEKFIVAWLDSRFSLTRIYLQYYDQSGDPEGSNIRLDNTGTLNLSNFDMAKTPSGDLGFSLGWF